MTKSFIPGLTNVAPEVLAAQARPVIPTHTKEFENLFQSINERLQIVLNTTHPVYLIASSGSGIMEASIRSLVKDKVLACVNGHFSQKWADMAKHCGKHVDRLEMNYGNIISVEQLRQAVKQNDYDVVTLAHCETSTGAINPIKDCAEVIQEESPQTLVVVDGFSTIGGMAIEMDEWGVDYFMTASHGAMGLPPGLSMAAISHKAMEKAYSVSDRGWYFDILRWEESRKKNRTPMMPNIPMLYALDAQLSRMMRRGLDSIYRLYREIGLHMQSWGEAHDLPSLAEEPHRSPTVSVLLNRPAIRFEDIEEFLLARGLRIGNGAGMMVNRTIRIGHMGDISMTDIEYLQEMLLTYIQHFM